MLLRLRVLRASPRGRLKLGINGARYSLTGRMSRVKVSDTLVRLAGACDDLWDILSQPPRTCTEWLSMYRKYCAILTYHRVPRMGLAGTSAYLLPWTFRVQCITRMRAHGIASLSLAPGNVTVATFSSMFPDQNHWIRAVARLAPAGQQTIDAVIQLLGYTGPLELLTMFLCLCQDKSLRNTSIADLSQSQQDDRVLQITLEHWRAYGFMPHPAVLAATLMSEDV